MLHGVVSQREGDDTCAICVEKSFNAENQLELRMEA